MARGGWRWGAGRPGWHVKAENCLRLDVRDLERRKLIGAGTFAWTWRRSDTGEETGSISVIADRSDSLTLRYVTSGKTVSDTIEIERTPCHYGGARPWFRCPRCSRRCAVVYLRAGWFKCRTCARVVYSSQAEDVIGRTWRRQRKIEARLGPDWTRPKGMHHRTRAALLERIFDCEAQREDEIALFLARQGWPAF